MVVLRAANEDFLVNELLKGIPLEVQLVFGKKFWTIEDLLSLPRKKDLTLSEKGVYGDFAFIERLNIYMSYVGVGAGKYGVLQRWFTYLSDQQKETTRHSREIKQPGTKMNLRLLAHYGKDPIAWVPHLAEAFFQILAGSVSDSGFRTEKTSNFVHDDLYPCYNEIQKDLPAATARGLNAIWTLLQGFPRCPIGSRRIICYNFLCGRKMVPRSDPYYQRQRFTSVDPSRPGEQLICKPCHAYEARNGKPRPAGARTETCQATVVPNDH